MWPDQGYSVEQTQDGGYIIAGYARNTYGPWFMKTDSQGNMEWEFKLEGNNYLDAGYSGQQTDDSGYIFTGEGRDGLFLLKTDPEGHYDE